MMWVLTLPTTSDYAQVGYYIGQHFVMIYDYLTFDEAERKVHYLNGGN